MNTTNSVNWNLLLDTNTSVSKVVADWSVGNTSTRSVSDQLAHSKYAGEFRNLVRSRGTTEARRLARKALRYRGTLV